jgi:hypothetical protein
MEPVSPRAGGIAPAAGLFRSTTESLQWGSGSLRSGSGWLRSGWGRCARVLGASRRGSGRCARARGGCIRPRGVTLRLRVAALGLRGVAIGLWEGSVGVRGAAIGFWASRSANGLPFGEWVPDPTWPGFSPFLYFPPHGQVAQLVEQRTENPRVGGSIPSLATRPCPLRNRSYQKDGHLSWVAVLPLVP